MGQFFDTNRNAYPVLVTNDLKIKYAIDFMIKARDAYLEMMSNISTSDYSEMRTAFAEAFESLQWGNVGYILSIIENVEVNEVWWTEQLKAMFINEFNEFISFIATINDKTNE